MSFSTLDLIITGGQVVTAEQVSVQNIGISEGKIVALGEDCDTNAQNIIDATGQHIFPGMIDPHVHFNEPGRTHWEGFSTGSQAAVAGGITTYFEMPLNASPPTIHFEALSQKKALAEAQSYCDFALWGGLVPGNSNELQLLYESGVIGFKAFMSNSGMDDFEHVDFKALKQGMQIIARFPGMRLALHAEDDTLTQQLAVEKIKQGKLSAYDYVASRPIQSELNAIQQVIDLAHETDCPVHIVHVSCAEGITLIEQAKINGLDITCETCPHYLYLTVEDLNKLGSIAKCAPPLRYPEDVKRLREKLLSGAIDVIGSDHSPCPTEMKKNDHLFKAWGGISGIQHAHTMTLGLAQAQKLDFSQITQQTHRNTAEIFNITSSKGGISLGKDADLCLVKFEQKESITADKLFYKNKHSPYIGHNFGCEIQRTLLRGQTVYQEGKIIDKPQGKMLRPFYKN